MHSFRSSTRMQKELCPREPGYWDAGDPSSRSWERTFAEDQGCSQTFAAFAAGLGNISLILTTPSASSIGADNHNRSLINNKQISRTGKVSETNPAKKAIAR